MDGEGKGSKGGQETDRQTDRPAERIAAAGAGQEGWTGTGQALRRISGKSAEGGERREEGKQ